MEEIEQRVCETCGARYGIKKYSKYDMYCPECRKNMSKALEKKRRRRGRVTKPNEELIRLAAEARKAGMSYGVYVASLRGE